MNQDYVIGVDLGGTKLDIALMKIVENSGITATKAYEIIENIKLATNVERGAENIVVDMVSSIDWLASKHRVTVKTVGIAVAGQVDMAGEVVTYAPNLGWKNVPLKKWFKKKFPKLCYSTMLELPQ